ncbi:hypothetical protein [Pseudanabaena sp. Chao 1811]|nr:hypothetical protein [Pseudanabaena sp. Chao 1811]
MVIAVYGMDRRSLVDLFFRGAIAGCARLNRRSLIDFLREMLSSCVKLSN